VTVNSATAVLMLTTGSDSDMFSLSRVETRSVCLAKRISPRASLQFVYTL